jgi:hypothetical protein
MASHPFYSIFGHEGQKVYCKFPHPSLSIRSKSHKLLNPSCVRSSLRIEAAGQGQIVPLPGPLGLGIRGRRLDEVKIPDVAQQLLFVDRF